MKNTVSVPIKQSQLNNIINDNYPYEEPNIRKAQFIRSLNRIYTLEFDQNIEMQELKIMIQKAAHLKKILLVYIAKERIILNIMMKLLILYFQSRI